MSEWRDKVRAWAMSETPRPCCKSPVNIAYFRGFDIVKQAVLEVTRDGRHSLTTLERRLEEVKREYNLKGAPLECLGLHDGTRDAIEAALVRCGKPRTKIKRKPLTATIYFKTKEETLAEPELRGKILALRKRGFTTREISEKVSVAKTSVHRVIKELERGGWLK